MCNTEDLLPEGEGERAETHLAVATYRRGEEGGEKDLVRGKRPLPSSWGVFCSKRPVDEGE